MKWSMNLPVKDGYYWYLTPEASLEYEPVVVKLYDGVWRHVGVEFEPINEARFLKVRKPHRPK